MDPTLVEAFASYGFLALILLVCGVAVGRMRPPVETRPQVEAAGGTGRVAADELDTLRRELEALGMRLGRAPEVTETGVVIASGLLHGVEATLERGTVVGRVPPRGHSRLRVVHGAALSRVLAIHDKGGDVWGNITAGEDALDARFVLSVRDDNRRLAETLLSDEAFLATLRDLLRLLPQGSRASTDRLGVELGLRTLHGDLAALDALAGNVAARDAAVWGVLRRACGLPGLLLDPEPWPVSYAGVLEGAHVVVRQDEQADGVRVTARPPAPWQEGLYIRSSEKRVRPEKGPKVKTDDLILDRALTVQLPPGQTVLQVQLGRDGLRELLVGVLRGHEHAHVSKGRVELVVDSFDRAVVESAVRDASRLAVALTEAVQKG